MSFPADRRQSCSFRLRKSIPGHHPEEASEESVAAACCRCPNVERQRHTQTKGPPEGHQVRHHFGRNDQGCLARPVGAHLERHETESLVGHDSGHHREVTVHWGMGKRSPRLRTDRGANGPATAPDGGEQVGGVGSSVSPGSNTCAAELSWVRPCISACKCRPRTKSCHRPRRATHSGRTRQSRVLNRRWRCARRTARCACQGP